MPDPIPSRRVSATGPTPSTKTPDPGQGPEYGVNQGRTCTCPGENQPHGRALMITPTNEPPGLQQLKARKPFRSLWATLQPSRARLVVSVVAYLIKDSPLWVMPVITAAVIDTVVVHGPSSHLLFLGAGPIALVGLNYPVTQLYVRLFSGSVRKVGVVLRHQLAHRLQELSIGFHTRSSSSIVQTKVVRDVETVELMLLQGANPALSAVGVLLGATTVIALEAPAFLALFALVVPVSVVLLRTVRRHSETRNELFRHKVEEFSSQVAEMASLLPITRARGLEKEATERLVMSAESVRDSGFSLDVLNGRFTAAAWVAFQFLSVACLIGAALVSARGLLPVSAGQVVLLSTYFAQITSSINNLLNLAPLIAKGRESVISIAEVLEDPDTEQNAGKRPINYVLGEISFHDVHFRYSPEDELAVTGLTLAIEPGQTIAFVGRSGSGKSTVLNLALGFLRPTSGRILLDGVDMEALDLRTVRRRVSIVPQASVLFSGTIRENITYGLQDVSEDLVLQALQDANALDFIQALPDGLDTKLGERGARLSGGQRQRISIARALIRDPQILLLDEATSALDSESEELVQGALANLQKGRTTLVVAHRLSTVRAADCIVVLDKGHIAESGSHEDLLKANGAYARLHEAQAM